MPRCKTVYTISATDAELRQDIQRYEGMIEKAQAGQASEKEIQEAQELLRANVTRNREIKARFPLEIKR